MINGIFIFTALVAIYANLAVIAAQFHDLPIWIAAIVPALLAVPTFHRIVVLRRPPVFDGIFVSMLAFLAIMLLASLAAEDSRIAIERMTGFAAEGLILYLLLVNSIGNWTMLRRAIWVLLITAGLLGALTLYQEVTGEYTEEFGGLAQRRMISPEGFRGDVFSTRAHGQIGEANRFAQIMLVLLPLALLRALDDRSWRLRMAGAAAGAAIFIGVMLTYSRGAFLAMLVMGATMIPLRLIPLRTALALGLAGALGLSILAPDYLRRMGTIGGVAEFLVEDTARVADPVTRSRLTEMAAAWNVFLDHPVLGVGPGHYVPFYSADYQLDPDIALRHIPIPRRAHNLYLETAAETGALGLVAFMAIVFAAGFQLYNCSNRMLAVHPQLARTAAALLVGIIGYLTAGMFLHLAYERYYWLLLALAGATLQISQSEETTCSES